MKQFTVNKNDYYTAKVEDLNAQGMGVVKIDGYPLFVDGTIPGELIKLKVTRTNKRFGYGRLIEIVESSPDRVEITDPIGRMVGTMTLQHISYARQLDYKTQQVKNAFERIGGFEDLDVRETIGMDHPLEYRNKAQIPVRMIDGQLETGFYRRGSHDLIPVENFYIQSPVIDDVLIIVRDILREENIAAYDEENHIGDIRHIIVKEGHYTGEIMIILVTNRRDVPHLDRIVKKIKDRTKHVVSIVQNIQSRRTNVILGQESHVLWGQDYYQDQMLGLDFKIGILSFYQVNTPQAERLYKIAIDAADLTGEEIVMDAYSGIGTITLSLAQHANHVFAMEIVPEAVEFAKENAKMNQIENVTFETGSAEEWIQKWDEDGIQFDVAVVDPPRKGLDQDFIEVLINQSPQKIVYVSCNPATQARDVRMMADAGYELQWVQPVDLFPQTPHVECVAVMKK